MYTPSMAASLCDGIANDGDPVTFYNGSNITFTDNAVTNQFAGEGVLFDGTSNVTVSNNSFANNYNQGMQLSNCKNCNVTGNYSVDSSYDIEDAGVMPAGYSTINFSNNTEACVNGAGLFRVDAGWRAFVGGLCGIWAGTGCSAANCTVGEYSNVTVRNVTVQNNTITGPGAVLLTIPSHGFINVINNSFTNGGVWVTR